MKHIKRFNEASEYNALQVGQQLKFKAKDGSERVGEVEEIYTDGVRCKGSLVTMDNLIEVSMRGKWYSKDEYFKNFA